MQASVANWNHEGTGGGREEGEGPGLAIKRHKNDFQPKPVRRIPKLSVAIWRGVIFVLSQEVILSIMLSICWDPREEHKIFTLQTFTVFC